MSNNRPFIFNLLHCIVFHLLEFLAVASHYRTMCTDPVGSVDSLSSLLTVDQFQGAIPLDDSSTEHLLETAVDTHVNRCKKCRCIKPERAHHCRY